jgi:hypothetical protein
MSRRSRTVLCCGLLFVLALVTSALLITRASPERTASLQTTAQVRTVNRGPRNLSLQPEALRVARQLGQRFAASSRASAVLVGTLTIAGSQQPLTITRRQTETGEQVNLVLPDRDLTWSAQEGTRAVAAAANESERLLAERLILDSPDQFVLANCVAQATSRLRETYGLLTPMTATKGRFGTWCELTNRKRPMT